MNIGEAYSKSFVIWMSLRNLRCLATTSPPCFLPCARAYLPFGCANLMTSIYGVLRPGGVAIGLQSRFGPIRWGYSKEDPNAMLAGILENQGKSVKNRHQWMYTEPTLVACSKRIVLSMSGLVRTRQGNARTLRSSTTARRTASTWREQSLDKIIKER